MTKDNEAELPKLIIHTLCGNHLFYYFGSDEDAKTLKNFNDICAMDGSGLSPEDVIACAHCGERIRIDQLQVVIRATNMKITDFKLMKEYDDYIKERELDEYHKNLIKARIEAHEKIAYDPTAFTRNNSRIYKR